MQHELLDKPIGQTHLVGFQPEILSLVLRLFHPFMSNISHSELCLLE